jgi:N-acyl homoserine lactone hydrolase
MPTPQPAPARVRRLTLCQSGALRVSPRLVCAAAAPGVASLPLSFGVIDHPERGPVLFDTGMGDLSISPLRALAIRLSLFRFDPAEDNLTARLAALNLKPADIQHVILSHLHYDHTGGLRALPHATIHVGRAEWAARALAPGLQAALGGFAPADYRGVPEDRLHRIDYDQPFTDCPPWTHGHDLFGDGSLWLLSTPGHTFGHQSLLVRLASGRDVLLLGDSVYLSVCFQGPHPVRSAIRRVFADADTAWHTTQRLHTLHLTRPNLTMIPCHDTGLGEALRTGPLAFT